MWGLSLNERDHEAALDAAERLIRESAAHLSEHPRCAWVRVDRYRPLHPETPPSIHLTAAFGDDGSEITGVDHPALSRRVSEATMLDVDPEYTRVFRWTKRNLIVYWWDWRAGGKDSAGNGVTVPPGQGD